MSLFGNIDRKKKIKKSSNHILKNHKMQNQKDTIENKINLILNKLSETNIDNLLFEFVDNINQVTEEEFEEIQKTFYSKIVSEINFIKIYLHFLKYIGFLYNKVQNFNLKYFIDIVYNNFININDDESIFNKILIDEISQETFKYNYQSPYESSRRTFMLETNGYQSILTDFENSYFKLHLFN